ncbi:MAG: sel1 repeat family protein [Proteobacteria bacterium]|nr:sel1 repeat family protein [Pseudomonadota bacterium]NOG59044.1 sel1 repeat family protein [Pseudomonadota bacterium]
MKKISLLLIILSTIITTPVRADFNDGVVTYLMGDYDKAFTTMQSLAETSDHGFAQYYLGMMYMKGQGVEQDYKLAGKWFRKASEKSIPQAQYKLGNLYYRGKGVPKDYEFAYVWFSVGAEHKHKLSMDAINKAKEKLSEDELKEADKLIAKYAKQYGPKEDIDPNQPIKIDNE